MSSTDLQYLRVLVALFCFVIFFVGVVIWLRNLESAKSSQNWKIPLLIGGLLYISYKVTVWLGIIEVVGFDQIEYTIVFLSGVLALKGYFAPIILSSTVAWGAFFILTEWRWEFLPIYELAVEGANYYGPPWFATAYIIVAVLFVFWRALSSISNADFSD